MGGTNGEIRGKSKAEVYAKYAFIVEQGKHTFNDHNPRAKYKKACKDLMEWDSATEEWVLHYRLHT